MKWTGRCGFERQPEGCQYLLFRQSVEVGRDFIEEEDSRIHDDGPGDGQELELAPGEKFLPERGFKSFGQGAAKVPQADQAQGFFDGFLRDPWVFEGHLVADGSGYVMELLFDVAEDLAAQGRGKVGRLTAEDADRAFFGGVETENEFKEGTLAGSGASRYGDDFPRFDG
mgnify:CR=1 FL=1